VIEEKAIVIDVIGQFAWVETQRKTTCGTCAAEKSCGSAVLQKVMAGKRTKLRVSSDIDVRVGESVIVGVPENVLVKGSFAVYAMPLIIMFITLIIGASFCWLLEIEFSENLQILFSMGGLGGGFWWLSEYTKRIRNDVRFQAKILRKDEQVVQFLGR